MVSPTFKKATDTTDGGSLKYGAPDIKYMMDVLDGTHSTDRIQISVLENKDFYSTFAFFIRKSGSNYQAFRGDTGAVAFTSANLTTLFSSVMGAMPAPSSAQEIRRIYVRGTDLETTTAPIEITKPCIIDGLGSCVIKKTGTYTSPTRAVILIESSNVTIRDLAVEIGDTADTTAAIGIQVRPTTTTYRSILLDHVRVRKSFIGIQFGASAASDAGLIQDSTIRDCFIDNEGFTAGTGGFGISLRFGCTNISVYDNNIYEPGGSGIDVAGTDEFIKIIGNHIQKLTNTADVGIDVNKYTSGTATNTGNTMYITIRDNRIVGPITVAGIRVRGDTEKIFITSNFIKDIAAGGIIIDNMTAGTDKFPKEVMILQNIIQFVTGSAIFAESDPAYEFPAFNISNNFITNPGVSGISCNSDIKHSIISNNMIYRHGRGDGTTPAANAIGIRLSTNCQYNIIMGNKIFGLLASGSTPAAGSGYKSIVEVGASSIGNIIVANSTNEAGFTLQGADTICMQNYGFATEAAGTASISSATSTAVTHGLGYTPALKDIAVTPTANMTTATKFWVSSPTSTQFTINISPSGSGDFAWQIARSY